MVPRRTLDQPHPLLFTNEGLQVGKKVNIFEQIPPTWFETWEVLADRQIYEKTKCTHPIPHGFRRLTGRISKDECTLV